MAGAGIQPAGTSSAGFGAPEEGNPQDGVVFRSVKTGNSNGSRFIDPQTRDFVMDEYGRTLGMANVPHLVQMAIMTEKGSSAIQSLGQELSKLDRITPNFEKRVLGVLTAALQHLIDARLVDVLGFEAFATSGTNPGISPGRVFGRLKWRDLSTGGEPRETII